MNNEPQAETRVALITGGNRGLGFETARELGEKGIRVVIGAREPDKGAQAVGRLAAMGIAAEAVRLDVTDPADHLGTHDYLARRFGRLDILVNNAGILIREPSCVVRLEDLRRIFETNFFAVVGLTQALLPLIRKSRAGRIVNLSSVLASLTLHSDPKSKIYNAKSFSYDASKTALNAYTVHLAYELRGTNIRVNSADPGWVKTEMGGEFAPTELSEGGKTSASLATLPDDGPSGRFIHLGEPVPW